MRKFLEKEFGNCLVLGLSDLEIGHAFAAYHCIIDAGEEYFEGENQCFLGNIRDAE